MKNPLIIIEVKGGLVQAVSSTPTANYIVVDHDNPVRIEDHGEADTLSISPKDNLIFKGRLIGKAGIQIKHFKDDLKTQIQQIISDINDKDYPNKRMFFIKDKSGRDYSGKCTTAQLLTGFDPDAECYNGERLFEYAEEAQPGDEWNSHNMDVLCIE